MRPTRGALRPEVEPAGALVEGAPAVVSLDEGAVVLPAVVLLDGALLDDALLVGSGLAVRLVDPQAEASRPMQIALVATRSLARLAFMIRKLQAIDQGS